MGKWGNQLSPPSHLWSWCLWAHGGTSSAVPRFRGAGVYGHMGEPAQLSLASLELMQSRHAKALNACASLEMALGADVFYFPYL
eukprot:1149489-Pelagomonas_calceolata.AAC.1